MTYDEIRKMYLNFFKDKGHTIVPSASLIPNDPTVLFTVAGMVPWVPVFKGLQEPIAPRVADSQKCLRAGGKHNDLEDVGFDGTHHTFFEMLGNWSFGDYFKAGAIEMSWELLTKVAGFDPSKIIVTTHITDDEATDIWKKVAGKEAVRLDKDNWWAMGDTGPCGPCTEMHYKVGDGDDLDKDYVEIWNDVFMQYDRDANGNLHNLPKQNVDTGAGLERWAAILQGKSDNYDTDLFANLIAAAESVVGVKKTADNFSSFKIISDHLRAVGFAIADGVQPSNTDRGYVIRRILRRAMRHGQILGHRGELLSKLYPALVDQMGNAYPELVKESARVIDTIRNEEHAFSDMLDRGMKLLDSGQLKIENGQMVGADAFKLYDTYGFPLDLTQMILRDRDITVDVAGFDAAMREQKERSKADTKGTRTLWESREDLPATNDDGKYDTQNNMLDGTVLAILKGGEFVDSANSNDELEIVFDTTPFYATMGGQVADSGEMIVPGEPTDGGMTDAVYNDISDVKKYGNLTVHIVRSNQKNQNFDIKVGDKFLLKRDNVVRGQIARAHTAAHLLQAALRTVLGDGVEQRGSKVAPDSVRFDFAFGRAMTAEEIAKTEALINEWIDAKTPVETKFPATVAAAEQLGAIALFGEKYEDGKIRAICVGGVSAELCGGTHAANTGDLMRVKINKEKSISAGIRRITMSVGPMAE